MNPELDPLSFEMLFFDYYVGLVAVRLGFLLVRMLLKF